MRIRGRFIAVVLAAVIGLTLAGPAHAQITNSTGVNTQTGDNRATTNENGSDNSGNAVGGQVSGVVANGRTSVDATNKSSNSDIQSGDADGSNSASGFTGLNAETGGGTVSNTQTGNNRTTVTETATATSGDGISGQVVGAVTEAGGSASIVAANTSDNNDVRSGDATFSNVSDSFVGLNGSPTATVATPGNASATNNQTGNNRLTVDQTALSVTGNAVAGQVIGVVSAGATSVDASNTSSNNDVDTVVTASDNSSLAFVGLDAEPAATSLGTASASNTQDGDNRGRVTQFAPGTANSANAFAGLDSDPIASGGTAAANATNNQTGANVFTLDQTAPTSSASVDSVAGQVVGAVTDAGGSASYVAANLSDNNSVENVGVAGQIIGGVTAGTSSVDASNRSTNNDVVGGVTSGSNDATAFVGLDADVFRAGPGAPGSATNSQTGNNRFTGSQSASTTSGEPVAGQVIGVVTSAGATSSIVAANVSDDNSVETGDATAPNSVLAFVGLDASASSVALSAPAPLASVSNTQTGNNRFTVTDVASATSGNGIAGQIVGVVSAGTSSVDARNNSTGNDVASSDALATNESDVQVGLAAAAVGSTGSNLQVGNNRKTTDQAADATTGDAIAAQVTGVVTSAGGSASVVVDNTSTNLDVTSGRSEFDNSEDAFVGLRLQAGVLALS